MPMGADVDGKQDAADAIIRQHSELSGTQLSAKLKDAGIVRSKSWVCERKRELLYDEMQKTGKRRPASL